MGKFKRRIIGSVVKDKNGGSDYIKISQDVLLKQGQSLRLESAKFQRENLEKALLEGKLSPELGDEIVEKINKIPTFVRFQIILLEPKE